MSQAFILILAALVLPAALPAWQAFAGRWWCSILVTSHARLPSLPHPNCLLLLCCAAPSTSHPTLSTPDTSRLPAPAAHPVDACMDARAAWPSAGRDECVQRYQANPRPSLPSYPRGGDRHRTACVAGARGGGGGTLHRTASQHRQARRGERDEQHRSLQVEK